MGAGGSVVVSGGVKTIVASSVASLGAAKVAAGTVGGVASLGSSEFAHQLVCDGWEEFGSGTTELARDGVMVLTTTAAVAMTAVTAGTARVVEERSVRGSLEALGGVLIEAPVAAVSQVVQGNGAGGAIVGAALAGHGRRGSLQDAALRQLEDADVSKARTLEEIREMNISECYTPELPLWQLAELAACAYSMPPKESSSFRCDLSSIRDPEDEVEASMMVYMRRRDASCTDEHRDLAVLVIRGTKDMHDRRLDFRSIVCNSYPAKIVLIAAEIVQMYQRQGCDVMVTGHSLGGYLAEVVATTIGLNGAAFCAQGPRFHNGSKAGSLLGFHAINHEADSIGNHNHESHQAKLVYLEDGGPLMLPWKSHSIQFMVPCLQKRKDWTNLNVLEKCKTERSRIPYHVFDGHRSSRR